MKNSLVIYTRGSTAAEAVEAFTSGFDQLAGATINPNKQRSIVDYYKKQFEKTEEAQTGDQIDVNGLLPTSNAPVLAGVLHHTLHRLGKGDQLRRRTRRQRLVGQGC